MEREPFMSHFDVAELRPSVILGHVSSGVISHLLIGQPQQEAENGIFLSPFPFFVYSPSSRFVSETKVKHSPEAATPGGWFCCRQCTNQHQDQLFTEELENLNRSISCTVFFPSVCMKGFAPCFITAGGNQSFLLPNKNLFWPEPKRVTRFACAHCKKMQKGNACRLFWEDTGRQREVKSARRDAGAGAPPTQAVGSVQARSHPACQWLTGSSEPLWCSNTPLPHASPLLTYSQTLKFL